MKPGATHIPVLEALFKAHKVKTVLEFGVGFHSTLWFAEHAESTHSIEDGSVTWYVETQIAVFEAELDKGWKGQKVPHSHTWLAEHGEELGPWDLIFVDGRRDNRPEVINAAFAHTKCIVAHDTEHAAYGWDRVEMPEGWEPTDHKELTPWTTVWRKKDAKPKRKKRVRERTSKRT
jgi:hypothetical protein